MCGQPGDSKRLAQVAPTTIMSGHLDHEGAKGNWPRERRSAADKGPSQRMRGGLSKGNPTKFRGLLDLGTAVDDDSQLLATEVLLFMNLPCAYSWMHGMGGAEKANLVNTCLMKLHDFGVVVCSAKVKLIRIFDKLLDVMNSKSPVLKNFKAPLRPFFQEAASYILGLKDVTGRPRYLTRRKTASPEFLLVIKSFERLCEELL
ncbi:hypothetical protein HPB47_017645, partial [Ixodes persulcatus]